MILGSKMQRQYLQDEIFGELNGVYGESKIVVRDAQCQNPLDDRYIESMEDAAGLISCNEEQSQPFGDEII